MLVLHTLEVGSALLGGVALHFDFWRKKYENILMTENESLGTLIFIRQEIRKMFHWKES